MSPLRAHYSVFCCAWARPCVCVLSPHGISPNRFVILFFPVFFLYSEEIETILWFNSLKYCQYIKSNDGFAPWTSDDQPVCSGCRMCPGTSQTTVTSGTLAIRGKQKQQTHTSLSVDTAESICSSWKGSGGDANNFIFSTYSIFVFLALVWTWTSFLMKLDRKNKNISLLRRWSKQKSYAKSLLIVMIGKHSVKFTTPQCD